MDLTSYLLGKKSGGAPSYTVKSGTTSVAGYQKILLELLQMYLVRLMLVIRYV